MLILIRLFSLLSLFRRWLTKERAEIYFFNSSSSCLALPRPPKMRQCNTISLLCFQVLLLILFSPCTAGKRRNRRRTPRLCPRLNSALQKAYFAQVDLIRRGLPTRIVQSEFTWAINQFLVIEKSFTSDKLRGKCLSKHSWRGVFDTSFRSIYAMKYLREMRYIFPSITFLSFEEYPTIPPMSRKEHNLVQSLWRTTSVRLQKRPRSRYKVDRFPFPQNVDVLYDPHRDQACEQYNKFRTNFQYKSKGETDAESVLVALTILSVHLFRNSCNEKAITQMLKHFVGYVFDGIRCLRVEGADIKIPGTLIEAYSRNVGMIRSTVTHATLEYRRIQPAAVKRVFKEEIYSLLSYNSWGHLQFAVLAPDSSLPMKINVITNIHGGAQFNLLLFYSKSPDLPTLQRSPSDGSSVQKNVKTNFIERKKKKKDYLTCDAGYVMMTREGEVLDPLERCCNEICYQWSLLMTGALKYSEENCCSRCNQANRCNSGITPKDLADNNHYSFFIPEYGDQAQIDMYLVVL